MQADAEGDTVVTHAAEMLKSVSKVVSSLIGLSVLACILGWLWMREYLVFFDADWILQDVSTPVLLTKSTKALFVVFLAVALCVSLLLTEKDVLGRLFGLRWCAMLVTVAVICWLAGGSPLTGVGFAFFVYLPGTVLYYLVRGKTGPEAPWSTIGIILAIAISISGPFIVNYCAAQSAGERDSDPQASGLPIVRVSGNSDSDLRLLHFCEDRFYVVKLSKDRTQRRLYVVQSSQIAEIRPAPATGP